MKYIVFSFDDALLDFYNNAYPLFKKYGFLCSINVITGVSDNTIKSEFNCMSINQIVSLYNEKFEIANHTNSHFHETTYEDIMLGDSKLKNIINDSKIGLILPYSQTIDDTLNDKIKNNFLYIGDINSQNKKRPFLLRLRRRLSFLNNENFKYYYRNFNYIYKVSHFKEEYIKFHRLPIYKTTSVDNIKYLLKKMRNGEVVIFMFHSIIENDNEFVVWGEGKWEKNKLDELLSYFKKHKCYKICTQKELIEYANRK